jgi:hypothetical protein
MLCVGCSTALPVPTTIRVPIVQSCISASDVPQRPPLASDTDLLAMDDRDFVLALARDRERLMLYVDTLETVVTMCK